jgi:Domain of unknown function (DUF4411)
MKVVIDTSSLISLVRNFLPLDKKRVLFSFIKEKIEIGDIIIIDKVLEECKYIAKGIVITTLNYLADKPFLKEAKIPYKTDSLIVPDTKQFFHQLSSVFVNNVIRKKQNLTDVEFENRKDAFMESADMKQIILCLNLIHIGEEILLVTEETASNNDDKLFKKIPAICKEMNINTMTFAELLVKYDGIDIYFM